MTTRLPSGAGVNWAEKGLSVFVRGGAERLAVRLAGVGIPDAGGGAAVAVTTRFPSGLKRAETTVVMPHRRAEGLAGVGVPDASGLVKDAVTTRLPSGLNSQDHEGAVWRLKSVAMCWHRACSRQGGSRRRCGPQPRCPRCQYPQPKARSKRFWSARASAAPVRPRKLKTHFASLKYDPDPHARHDDRHGRKPPYHAPLKCRPCRLLFRDPPQLVFAVFRSR